MAARKGGHFNSLAEHAAFTAPGLWGKPIVRTRSALVCVIKKLTTLLKAYAKLNVMRIIVLYRPESEYARVVEEFIHDYQNRHNDKLEIINIDSREGIAMASLYDIMRFPALLALREDGTLLKNWEGGQLPLMDEVAAYAYS